MVLLFCPLLLTSRFASQCLGTAVPQIQLRQSFMYLPRRVLQGFLIQARLIYVVYL